jgi:phosphatidate cytidylyltransferase
VLRLRVLTAVVGLPVIVISLALGPYAFGLFLGVVAATCTFELCRLAPNLPRWDALAWIAVALSVLLATLRILPQETTIGPLLATGLLMLSLLMIVVTPGLRRTFVQWSWTIAGAVYVGWLLGHWAGLYVMPAGLALVVFGIFTTFFYDTFAYFTGRAFGRHKLAPRLSAGKTWEGAVGGLLMAFVGGLLIRWGVRTLVGAFPLSIPWTLVAAGLVAVAAQMGDLVESALKRSAGAKDAGGILPGHGGMLDRFDSLLFVGPVLYYLVLWVTA